MKLPLVSRKKYEWAVASEQNWRKRSKFVLTIPIVEIDGIGEVQMYGSPQQIEMIQERLGKRCTTGCRASKCVKAKS